MTYYRPSAYSRANEAIQREQSLNFGKPLPQWRVEEIRQNELSLDRLLQDLEDQPKLSPDVQRQFLANLEARERRANFWLWCAAIIGSAFINPGLTACILGFLALRAIFRLVF